MNVKGYELSIWDGQKMGNEVTIDVETNIAPFHTRLHKLVLFQAFDGVSAYLVNKEDVRSFLLTNYHATLIGQNIKFDMGVIANEIGWSLLYKFYDRNQVRDTKLMFQLWALAFEGSVPHKGTSLAAMVQRFFNVTMSKDEAVRCTFGPYLDRPISEIPDEHIEYAILDVIYTHKLYKKLLELIDDIDEKGSLLSLDIQMKGDLALDSLYKNGVGVDLEAVSKRKVEVGDRLGTVENRMALWGYIKGRPGVLDIYENIMEHIGIADKLPRSPKSNRISSKEEDLRPYMKYPFVQDYIEYIDLDKTMSFLTPLNIPVIHPQYKTILNTGRTSCTGSGDVGGVNMQQLPKTGGIRECFIPKKEGYVFLDIDYSAIELSALAQVTYNLYGYSRMRDLINEGKDLHVATAASNFKVDGGDLTKENRGDVTTDQRNFAKIVNFGLGGGMGARTFTKHSHTNGFPITIETAEDVKENWIETYPETEPYFDEPNKYVTGKNEWGKPTFTQTGLTGRVKSGCTYSSFLNLGFQGLAADGLKLALYRLVKEGYHVVCEVHDAIIVEVKEEEAEAKLAEMSKIMIEEMRKVIPDVKVSVEGKICKRMEK